MSTRRGSSQSSLKEIWKDIEEFPGYQVSNLGRVRSVDRRVHHPNLGTQFVKGRIMACDSKTSKYKKVWLCRRSNNRFGGRLMQVHRLVAMAFITNAENKETVNHKDGDPANNRVDNLEWATRRENEDHAVANGLKARGSRNNKTKLKASDVIEIRKALEAEQTIGGRRKKGTLSLLAEKYKVTRQAIFQIGAGKSWRYLES